MNEILLIPAKEEDIPLIHKMQVRAFLPLLEKYHDDETSPARVSCEAIRQKFYKENSAYHWITAVGKAAGVIRVVVMDHQTARISPLFIDPEFQRQGIAREALAQIELVYPQIIKWELMTILQESRNCRLYENAGYQRVGDLIPIHEMMDLVHYEKNLSLNDASRI